MARAAEVDPVTSAHDGAPHSVRERLTAAVTDRADALIGLARDLHANPEVQFSEHRSVGALAKLLADQGVEAEVGVYGLPTALRAQAGDGAPRVAILAEYDALPGIGHACGHNVICATAAGAFLALADVMGDLDGAAVLLGTPGEEGGGGKEIMAQAGAFDDIDAVVMLHPFGADAAEHPWLGVRQVEVSYHGLSAHAAAMPFMGRNALDAVVQAYTGIAALRQHILPTDRAHGVITRGGAKPNIVPDVAGAQFYLRSAEPETLAELTDRARDIFESAAVATGTRLEVDWNPCPVYLPVRNNGTLAERYAVNVGERGRKVLPRGVLPAELTGSTDLGNVSLRVPAIHPLLGIAPADVTIHTPEFAEWAVGERADAGTVDGAIGLALTAADFLTDSGLRDAVAEEFASAGGPADIAALTS
jgi:amidohydrolase